MLNDLSLTSESERLLTALSFLRNNSWFKFQFGRSFLMFFNWQRVFIRQGKVVKDQYTSRFAVIKMIASRFYIAADQKMM